MNRDLLAAAWFALALTPLGIADMGNKEPIGLTLVVKPGVDPLREEHVALEIKNGGDEPLEIWSKLPDGIDTCLDVAVRNAEGDRVTAPFYRRSISSPFKDARLIETIPKGKSIMVAIKLFEGVEALQPGKYKCRIRFEYEGLTASSQEVEFEVTKTHIDNRGK